MGFGSWLLVIIIAIVAWLVIWPTSFHNTYDSIFGSRTVDPPVTAPATINKTTNTTKLVNTTVNTSKTNLQATPKNTTIVNTTNTTVANNSVPAPAPVDPCKLPYHGLPNYAGTNKEGQDCADTLVNPDFECLANPPSNYDGYIDVISRFSSPQIYCCKTDGFCRWGYH